MNHPSITKQNLSYQNTNQEASLYNEWIFIHVQYSVVRFKKHIRFITKHNVQLSNYRWTILVIDCIVPMCCAMFTHVLYHVCSGQSFNLAILFGTYL